MFDFLSTIVLSKISDNKWISAGMAALITAFVGEELSLSFKFRDGKIKKQIRKLEQMADFLNEKISNFIYSTTLKSKTSSTLIRISNEYELISDLGVEFYHHSEKLNLKNNMLNRLFLKIKKKILENIFLCRKLILKYNEKDYRKVLRNKVLVMEYIKKIYDLKLESIPLSNLIHISETIVDKTISLS